MLASVLFAVLAAGQLLLAGRCAFRVARTRDRLPIVPALVCAALAYDNAVIAAGRWIGAGASLESWSVPRFTAHILLTPLLMPWARAAAARAGVGRAGSPRVRAAVTVLTVAVIALGALGELTPLALEPREWAGTVRYTTAHASVTAVLSPVVTVLVVLVAAIAMWRVRGYRLWTVTTVIMTVVSAAMPPMLVTNCAELVFTAGITATAMWLSRPVGAAVVVDRGSGSGGDEFRARGTSSVVFTSARTQLAPGGHRTGVPAAKESRMTEGKDLALSHIGVLVGDQQEAVEFYRDVIGLEVRADMPFGPLRWVTVGPAGRPGVEFILETPAMVPDPEQRAEAARRLAAGAHGTLIFATESVDATFTRLRDAEVRVGQEPVDQPYGVRDCGFVDPWGNFLRFSQPLS